VGAKKREKKKREKKRGGGGGGGGEKKNWKKRERERHLYSKSKRDFDVNVRIMSSAFQKLASEKRRAWALAQRAKAALLRRSDGKTKGIPTPPNPDPHPREIYFPNLQLRLVPPTEEARARGVEVATFITTPNVTKTEVKAFLTQVHGIEVLRVDTANYEGKKKRNLERGTWFRKPDYKKVYVTLGERWFPPERFCVPNK
tara:strand:+ start:18 stop:617 length:600 start_codon:yes stop_codon:yes gene_type:complete